MYARNSATCSGENPIKVGIDVGVLVGENIDRKLIIHLGKMFI